MMTYNSRNSIILIYYTDMKQYHLINIINIIAEYRGNLPAKTGKILVGSEIFGWCKSKKKNNCSKSQLSVTVI